VAVGPSHPHGATNSSINELFLLMLLKQRVLLMEGIL